MATQTATIQLRIDQKTKNQAQNIFKKLGLDVSSAVKMFFREVINKKSIPFRTLSVNGYTPEYEKMILDEWKSMKAGNEKTFTSVEAFMKDLNS